MSPAAMAALAFAGHQKLGRGLGTGLVECAESDGSRLECSPCDTHFIDLADEASAGRTCSCGISSQIVRRIHRGKRAVHARVFLAIDREHNGTFRGHDIQFGPGGFGHGIAGRGAGLLAVLGELHERNSRIDSDAECRVAFTPAEDHRIGRRAGSFDPRRPCPVLARLPLQ